MSAILGSLLGFASSLLPNVVDFFQKKEERKQKNEEHRLNLEAMQIEHRQKIELLKLQSQVDITKSAQSIKELEAQGDLEQTKQIYAHDTILNQKNENKFVSALSASVRPVVTYVFFIMFLAVKSVALYLAYKNNVSLDQLINVVWNDETNAIFAAVISFWFGQRAMQKFSKK